MKTLINQVSPSMPIHARSEDATPYKVDKNPDINTPMSTSEEDKLIAHALLILDSRLKKPGVGLSSPSAVKKYLTLQLAGEEIEYFCAMFLDVKNRVISFKKMFSGTLTQCAVYPREIVKNALSQNACSVIFSHNHPSGDPEPSMSDDSLTATLKIALDTVGIRVLDHVVIGAGVTYSYAEHGRI